jgi:hypothetical protein
MSSVWCVRAAVLTLVGELAVHHGRFLFATSEHEHELASAHRYFTGLVPVVGVLLFMGVVHFLVRLGRESEVARSGMPRVRALWLANSLVLLGVFVTQESAETFFTHGHLPELGELFGAGGWTAILFAFVVGAVVALLLRGAVAVVAWARRSSRRRVRRGASSLPVPRPVRLVARESVLARRLAGRAPPSVA